MFTRKRTWIGFVVFFLCIGSSAETRAQEGSVLTLEAAIQRARSQSPGAQIAQLQFERASWDFRSFRAEYLPSVSLSGDAPGLDRSISDIVQDDGSVRYVSQSRMFSTARIGIYQPLPFSGGQVYVSSALGRIDLFGDQSSNQWQAAPLVIGLQQPLFQFNAMKWNRRLEPLRFRYAQRQYVENVAQLAVEVTGNYFDVVMAQLSVQNATFNVAVNDTIYRVAQGRYELGKIAENDLLQSELALLNARTDLSDAQIAYDRSMQDLKTVLGLPYDTRLTVLPPDDIVEVIIDPAAAVARARENRAGFIDHEITSMEAERNVIQARHNNGFTASLTAEYGLNQSSDDISNLYDHPLDQQRFSIGFQIPLYQWGRGRAQFEAALAEQDRVVESLKLERAELEQQVYFETLHLMQLQQQVKLAAKADTIASRRFEVARNRYTIGKIDITDLFQAQTAKDASSQAYIQTLRQYWTSYFQLQRLTGYDFHRNEPLKAGS